MQSRELECGARIDALLAAGDGRLRPMPLLPAGPAAGPRLEQLRQLALEDLFDAGAIRDQTFARCVQSGLYLYFSALQESHAISQCIRSSSGSYWHGIMHRQEGDWGNAKHWFRRVGAHPVLAELEAETGSVWNLATFVDRCSADHVAPDLPELQMHEWRLLMRHCYRHATRA